MRTGRRSGRAILRDIWPGIRRWCLEAVWVRGETEAGRGDRDLMRQWLDLPAGEAPCGSHARCARARRDAARRGKRGVGC